MILCEQAEPSLCFIIGGVVLMQDALAERGNRQKHSFPSNGAVEVLVSRIPSENNLRIYLRSTRDEQRAEN